MMRLFVLITALVCVYAASPTDPQAWQEFVDGNHQFTADVYKELLKTNSGNFLVSPLSAETILALTAEGAKEATLQELQDGLKLPKSQEKTRSAIAHILPQLQTSTDNLKLLSANKVYLKDGFKVLDSFKDVAVKTYKSEVENVNFSEKEGAANTINQWVAGKTNDKIQGLISPDALSEDTRVVLVNALYFSGKWVHQFEPFSTQKEKFYTTEKDTVDVDMMHLTESLKYYEDAELDAKFLELPYDGGEVTMTIVLPNKKEGLQALEQKVDKLFKQPNYKIERVNVALPKFTFETKIAFVPILKQLGVRKLFDGTVADLSGIDGEKDLYVSDVIQKAFINVTESGTEAAAATAVLNVVKSGEVYIGHPIPFTIDHPFLFILKAHSVVLFAGRTATNFQ